MVVCTYESSIQEAQPKGSPKIGGQPDLHNEFRSSLNYRMSYVLLIQKQTNKCPFPQTHQMRALAAKPEDPSPGTTVEGENQLQQVVLEALWHSYHDQARTI